MEQLLRALEDQASKLQKAQQNLKKCPKARLTRGYIEVRLQVIEDYWNEFKKNHTELIKISTKEQRMSCPYFVNEDYYIYEDLYLNIRADLKDMLNIAPGHSATEQQAVILPRIQLPTFTGSYEEWTTFHDMFLSLVHTNSTLSQVQKFHYLKTSLAGEAASLLKYTQVTESNYAQAWATLVNRFGNTKLIVNAVLKRLYTQKKMSSQSTTSYKQLLDVTTECLNQLINLKINIDSWDPIIVFLVVQKLDPESHKEWEEHAYQSSSKELSKWDDLKKFLETKYRTFELVTPAASARGNPTSRPVITSNASTTPTSNTPKTCILCNENHKLCHCKKFVKMSLTERGEYVKKSKLCFNCLAAGHSARVCRVSVSCRICQKRHHSLLHMNMNDSSTLSSSSHQATNQSTSSINSNNQEKEDVHVNTSIASNHAARQGMALLATALVTVRNDQGHAITMRALIDQGSQASFISEKAAQTLHLPRQHAKASVIGVGSTRTNINQVVQLHITSRTQTDYSLQVKAYVMSKSLTTKIPAKIIKPHDWPHLEGLQLADPNYNEPGHIDLLLGVTAYAQIMHQRLIKGPPGTPCAQATTLGWILFGEINPNTEDTQKDSLLVMHLSMDEMLETIWEVDTTTKRTHTKEERLCEEQFEKTHTRNEDGRYIVRLPFKTDNPKSPEGNTIEIARNRLLQLERRFKRNPKLKEVYKNVIEEYITLNHMEEVPIEEIITKQSVYLPHHPVIREDKETTKTRVVFDASAKGTNHTSLNDELLVGPPLQDDLRSLIMRWRTKQICFTADIQMMYRQVLVSKAHTDYQRLLWRDDETKDIRHLRLLRVTFGTAAAPYLAVKVLQQIADDEGYTCTKAAQAIKQDFYMDDLMSGEDTVEDAINTAKDIRKMLKKGGYKLMKWSSNNLEFMKSIEPKDRSTKAQIDMSLDGKVKALGILWNLGTDEFQYNFNLIPNPTNITKRTILSDLQKLFDPLGWLAPSIVQVKILVQQLWKAGVNWDDHVNPELENEWRHIRTDFENVNDINVKRWINTLSSNKDAIELHGFSDASIKAYGAVVYCRVVSSDDAVNVNIIAARTRVAPLKTISLPRLELCGAVLLANLLEHVGSAMKIPVTQMYAWTDSTIVLAWLSGSPTQWKTFVSNRVVEIDNNIPVSRWHHVASRENPADIASRGMMLSDLKRCNLWWQGPQFLKEKNIKYTKHNTRTELETKKTEINANLKIQEEAPEKERRLAKTFGNFQSLDELLKTITYCKRFLNSKRDPETDKTITTEELQDSLTTCIKIVQAKEYEEEIENLKEKKELKRKSKIISLNPYLDENGILRVGGRLRHANLEEDYKHSIILGCDNKLTPLIIADAHKKTLHGGIQLMLCFIRAKYWIVRAKGMIKAYNHKCIICSRQSASARTQIMGDLPKQRVTPSRPFLHSGVDFAGPFQILLHKGRGAKTRKAYICIFICMSTKAIHLELVGDMTSEAFIGSFKRFVARRGRCSHLWSDQGRNFVGANKELRTAWKEANMEFTGGVVNTLATDGTQWHFIPAYSPHFGGLWEAGVKSIKYHLKRILSVNLTFEEMSTLLCEIEACLNSRPLCPIDDTDPDQVAPLTPGHFLVGEAPIVVPSPDKKNIKLSALSRWQYSQKLLNDFWHRWQQEYLSRLQQRPKWLKKQREFNIGDIVLIKTDNLPPGKWAMGRILDKHPGVDGATRVYSVKSGNSVVKRPITKLCYLPVDTLSDDDE